MLRRAVAETKRKILPKGTRRESLIELNPNAIDPRNLEITPLNDFGTMGLTDQEVNLEKWRLKITGEVKNPISLTYEEIKALPVIERNVLQICPGVFANYGQWKGVSIRELLTISDPAKPARAVIALMSLRPSCLSTLVNTATSAGEALD